MQTTLTTSLRYPLQTLDDNSQIDEEKILNESKNHIPPIMRFVKSKTMLFERYQLDINYFVIQNRILNRFATRLMENTNFSHIHTTKDEKPYKAWYSVWKPKTQPFLKIN